MKIREITKDDKQWIQAVFSSISQTEDSTFLEGFIAEEDGRKVGLITYVFASETKQSQFDGQSSIVNSQYSFCQIISLNVLTPGKGIGAALLAKVEEVAKKAGCQKITVNSHEVTNDFFLKKGFISQDVYLEKILMLEYKD